MTYSSFESTSLQNPPGERPMDASRSRRTRDRARQEWYARHRQRRFARFLGFVKSDEPETRSASSHDHSNQGRTLWIGRTAFVPGSDSGGLVAASAMASRAGPASRQPDLVRLSTEKKAPSSGADNIRRSGAREPVARLLHDVRLTRTSRVVCAIRKRAAVGPLNLARTGSGHLTIEINVVVGPRLALAVNDTTL